MTRQFVRLKNHRATSTTLVRTKQKNDKPADSESIRNNELFAVRRWSSSKRLFSRYLNSGRLWPEIFQHEDLRGRVANK